MISSQKKEIDLVIIRTLDFFATQYHYSNGDLPSIKNTYALWRNFAYQNMIKHSLYTRDSQEANLRFYEISECDRLPCFIKKLQPHFESGLEFLKQKVENNEQLQLTMGEVKNKLWQHKLYCQLFQDLITLPYLSKHLQLEPSYKLKDTFKQLLPSNQQQNQVSMDKVYSQIAQKASQSAIKKGFSGLFEIMFTKTFLIRASSFAVQLNPTAMAATFAFSSLVDYYKKYKKQGQILEEMKRIINQCNENLQILKCSYQQCIFILKDVLEHKPMAIQIFLNKLNRVMKKDWLKIEKIEDQNDWQIVILQGRPSEDQKLELL